MEKNATLYLLFVRHRENVYLHTIWQVETLLEHSNLMVKTTDLTLHVLCVLLDVFAGRVLVWPAVLYHQ